MKIWALADLHLNIGVPEKNMDVFGPLWENYTQKIQQNWKQVIGKDDLVLIAGDISWALKAAEAKKDLDWIGDLPGTKVLLKGNHDHWWTSKSKVLSLSPPSIKVIQYDSIDFGDICIGGARLWDTEEYNFAKYIIFKENPRSKQHEVDLDLQRRLFEREIKRMQMSLESMDPNAKIKIFMTHYPPIGADLKDSRASKLLEKYQIDYCVFGHLHNVKQGSLSFGEKNGVNYIFTSSDYLAFQPQFVYES